MASIDDVSVMFHVESDKLENILNNVSTVSENSLADIIEAYYQVMNVVSLITVLRQNSGNDNPALFDKIAEIEMIISEKFNSHIHPSLMQNLSSSIERSMRVLQSKGDGQKSKKDIENDAKLYEELRQMMSTKEFVEQYDKRLHD